MLATVKSMQAPTKEDQDELYLMSLEEPMSTPIVKTDNGALCLNGSLSSLNSIRIKYLENLHLFYSFVFRKPSLPLQFTRSVLLSIK